MGPFLRRSLCALARLGWECVFPKRKGSLDLFVFLGFCINYTLSVLVSGKDYYSSLVATSGTYNVYKMATIMFHVCGASLYFALSR